MSKYFGFVDGKPYDFKFKKDHFENWKKFYLGEFFICIVIKTEHCAGWTVIVQDVEDRLQTPSKVEGFVSRHAAVHYALMTHPLTRDQYNQNRQQELIFKEAENQDD